MLNGMGVQKLLCSLSNYEAITGHAGPELHIDELPSLEAKENRRATGPVMRGSVQVEGLFVLLSLVKRGL